MLALRIENISSPPDPNIPAAIGFIEENRFIQIANTYAYNYPQGSRQQWIADTNSFIVNDRLDQRWCSKVYDCNTSQLIDVLSFPTHILTKDGFAFSLDYSRLHRVGGYGYTGIKDQTSGDNAPTAIGIIKHHIYGHTKLLLISIKDVANFQMNESQGRHHYITHLRLNPSENKIAFLHRFKLNDGGETTRLMTIDLSGNNLHCLATGSLSHFDWKDDFHLAIWGRCGTGVEQLRNSRFYKILPTSLVSTAKKMFHSFKKVARLQMDYYPSEWLVFSDEATSFQSFLAKAIMLEDGHPMFCPVNRDWLVCDTYPDIHGIRTLYLFQVSTNSRFILGKYKMIDSRPNILTAMNTIKDVEKAVIKSFSAEKMIFYRSGLHCDLHPRWNFDGSKISFDSIHEGKRYLYEIDVQQYLGI